jgi:hypothetical protein
MHWCRLDGRGVAHASVGAKAQRHFTAPAEEYNAQSAPLRARGIRDDEDEE